MKIIAADSTSGTWIWTGEGDPVPNLLDIGWLPYPYKFLEIQREKKYEPELLLYQSWNPCFVADVPIEQFLTCDDEEVREWATEQARAGRV